MSKQESNHLTDEQIVRLIDGETPAHQAGAEKQHLAVCQGCQARQLYLQSFLAEMITLLNPALDAPLLDGAPARAQLKAQMDHASRPTSTGGLRRLEIALFHQPQGLLYAELAIIVLVPRPPSTVQGHFKI